jgi:hypothetical protein
MTPYGQSLMTTAAPGELSGYGTDSGGYPGWGRLEQQQQPGDRYLKTALGGSGVLDGDGALKWPVALTALPDAEAARLRKDIQAALESAAARRERGQSATAALRGVAPAVKQLTAMLYAKKGEITDESYQESLRFLRKLNEAARDLR